MCWPRNQQRMTPPRQIEMLHACQQHNVQYMSEVMFMHMRDCHCCVNCWTIQEFGTLRRLASHFPLWRPRVSHAQHPRR